MGWFEIARILILAQVLITVAATIWNLPGAYRSLLNYEPGPGFQGWSREQIQTVVQGSGLDPVLLATNEREYRTPARRPKYSALSNAKMERVGVAPLPSLRDVLTTYFKERTGQPLSPAG